MAEKTEYDLYHERGQLFQGAYELMRMPDALYDVVPSMEVFLFGRDEKSKEWGRSLTAVEYATFLVNEYREGQLEACL